MKTMKAQVEKLAQYRRTVDALFDLSEPSANELRTCFSRIWWAATELYAELARWVLAVDSNQSLDVNLEELELNESSAQLCVRQEIDQRNRLRALLQSFNAWNYMCKHSMAELASFNSSEDYINSLTLHLPEIYYETLQIEEEIAELIRDGESFPDVVIDISIKHALQNHLSFVLPALLWLSELTSWSE
jgi:hypothetical protein